MVYKFNFYNSILVLEFPKLITKLLPLWEEENVLNVRIKIIYAY